MFSENDHPIVRGLLNNMSRFNDSHAFQGNMLKLGKLVAENKKDRFFDDLRVRVLQENSTSVVSVFLDGLDDAPFIETYFKGEFKVHDRLFDKHPGLDSIYQLKPNAIENQLIRDLYIHSLHMNALWNDFDLEIKNNLLKEASAPIKNTDVLQIWKDLPRTEEFFPRQAQINDNRILTQEYFRSMVRNYFSPVLENYSGEFNAVYQNYSDLHREDQRDLLKAINDSERGKNSFLEGRSKLLQGEFDRLASEEKEEMKNCMAFLLENQYKGTIDQFMNALHRLPLKEKAICLITAHQGFKTILEALFYKIAFDSNYSPWLKKATVRYNYKVTSVDNETRCVIIETKYLTNFEPFINWEKEGKNKLPFVAQEIVKAKFTVIFPESGNLVASDSGEAADGTLIRFHEDELKFNLHVLDLYGYKVQHCARISPEDELSVSQDNCAQLQKKRLLPQMHHVDMSLF
jgi:hypothetical protein